MERRKFELRGCHLEEALKFSDQFNQCIDRIFDLYSGVNPELLIRCLVPFSGGVKNG